MTPASSAHPTIRITRFDLERLARVLKRSGEERHEALRGELDRAEVFEPDAIPPDVVTMNSRARFVDEETGAHSEVTLVFPEDADAERGRISILAPVGSALLGLAVGASIEWPVPGGRVRRLRVTEVSYQPEAAGDHDL